MTERKTGGRLAIFQRVDPGDVPAPWVPPELPSKDVPGLDAGNVPAPWVPAAELPASKDAPGLDAGHVPAPWVPAELPATAVPVLKTDDRKLAKLKPWMPPELRGSKDAPRNLPAAVADHLPATMPDDETAEPKKRKTKRDKQRKGELTTETAQTGQPININIVNQVAAPAPVYVSPWWGWWGGGCPRAFCPHRAGRTCWRFWCW
jgi:hypothetical protein